MTGRELMTYILQNHLEDEEILTDDLIPGFLPLNRAAMKLDTGVNTLRAHIMAGKIKAISITGGVYVPIGVINEKTN